MNEIENGIQTGRIAKFVSSNVIILMIFAAAISIFCFTMPRAQPYFFSFEHKYADWRTVLFSKKYPSSHQDIVLILVTEKELTRMNYRSPIDRKFLANLVSLVDQSHPKVIGIDILIDQPTEIEKDLILKNTILSSNSPIVLANADSRYPRLELQKKFNMEFIEQSKSAVGFVNIPSDEDDTIRELPHSFSEEFPLSFAEKIFETLFDLDNNKGEKPNFMSHIGSADWKERISWRGRPTDGTKIFSEVRAGVLLDTPKLAPRILKDKVVIIGVEIPGTDKYKTPFSVLGQTKKGMSGVRIHTHMVAQFMDGRNTRMLNRFLEALIYFLTAIIGLRLAMSKQALASKTKIFSILGVLSIVIDILVFKSISVLIPTAMILFCLSISIALPGTLDRGFQKLKKLLATTQT